MSETAGPGGMVAFRGASPQLAASSFPVERRFVFRMRNVYVLLQIL